MRQSRAEVACPLHLGGLDTAGSGDVVRRALARLKPNLQFLVTHRLRSLDGIDRSLLPPRTDAHVRLSRRRREMIRGERARSGPGSVTAVIERRSSLPPSECRDERNSLRAVAHRDIRWGSATTFSL